VGSALFRVVIVVGRFLPVAVVRPFKRQRRH